MPVNLPTSLTLYRFVAALGIVAAYVFLERGYGDLVALLFFVTGSVSDFLDGYLARKLDMSSDLGRMLDPIADKVMVVTALIVIASSHGFGTWFMIPAVIIIAREFVVSGMREFLGSAGQALHVTNLAKWKTTFQMLAIAVLFFFGAYAYRFRPHHEQLVQEFPGPGAIAGLVLLWIAAGLSLMTGMDYVRSAVRTINRDNHHG